MSHYLDYELFSLPEKKDWSVKIKGRGLSGLLVVVAAEEADREGSLDFLESILQAVELTPLSERVHLLQLNPEDQLPVIPLCREKGVDKVLLFGLPPAQAGLQARWPAYTFARLSGVRLLWAHPLEQIKAERQAGDSRKAAALWKALKTHLME
ncbi:MAG: hypothetical protein KDC54_08770 [Lewinella sp.]|nr:hypothetical protein [Lewinella sp.]